MSTQIDHWERLSSHPPDASVIDPNDRLGYKNRYITGLRNEAILRRLPSPHPDRPVLDFGCGTGGLSAALTSAGHSVIGLDISQGLLRRTAEREPGMGHVFARFDGQHVPLADDSVFAVVTYVVLNHIIDDSDLSRVLAELHRVLVNGGRVIAIEQVRRRSRIDLSAWQHRRTIDHFENLFARAKLRLVSREILRYGRLPTTYALKFGLIPPQLWAPLRALERSLGKRIGVLPWDYSDTCFMLEKR